MKKLKEILEQTFHLHWWLAPLLLVFAGGLCLLGAELGKPYYVRRRSARSLVQAREFLRAHDLPRAGVALQVAMRGQPTLEAYELLGDFDEAAGLVQAVAARRLASQASSLDSQLKLEFARTALRFSDLAAAREALAALSPPERETLAGRQIEASYALLAGEWARAARLLAALKQESPSDTGVRLLDDSLNIRDAEGKKAGAAREDLRRLAGDTSHGLDALRVLLADAVSHGNSFAASEAGQALAAASGATFADLLNAASAENRIPLPEGIDRALKEKIRIQASGSFSAAIQYGRWLLLEKHPDEAEAWLHRLPPDQRKAPAVAEIDTQIATTREDWDSLRLLLQHGAWGPALDHGLDFAFAARILQHRGKPELAEAVWSEALGQCAASESSLRILARLADIWRWPDRMQAALFTTVQNYPGDQVAYEYLIGLLRVRRDSPGLLRLLTLRKAAGPLTDRQMADWAFVSLLVEPRTKPDTVTALLDSLYQRNSDDAYIATDHALELWQLGRVGEACAVADRLSPDDRTFAGRAPCLAVIYATAGRWTEAQTMINRAPRPAELWPEEVELVARAAAMIRR